MKYCEEYAVLLDLYVDGELPVDETARVRDHLAACPGCRAYVDDALALRAGFADVEDTVVPEGFAEGVMERVRRDLEQGAKAAERKRGSTRRWMGSLGALAACCALVILVRSGSGGLGGGNRSERMAITGDVVTDSCDTDGDAGAAASENEESGIAPQMTLQDEAKQENGPAMRAKSQEEPTNYVGEDVGDIALAALPAEAAPEFAMDADPGTGATLYLSAEEAGELLSGFVPAWENEEERGYVLTAAEYQALLEALGRPDETAEAETVLVVVSGPFD